MDIYGREEMAVIKKHGEGRCLVRTSNGAPWRMPCFLDEGHEGEHRADSDTVYIIEGAARFSRDD